MQGESILQSAAQILFSLTLAVRTLLQGLGILPAPCEEPLKYTLGAIDERFGISETEVLAAMAQAEAVWEKDSGKNLFEYDKEFGLPVQFIYDERQEKTQAGKDLQERLDGLKVAESESEVKAQIAKYEQAKKEYEQTRVAYEKEAATYNNRVERINKSGGATESQQKELQAEYEALQDRFQKLESARQKVNSLVTTTNQHISKNQTLVEAYNSEVTTFQDQYGGEGEVFDQGVYTGSDIAIYQYDDTPRLVLVLAHEMGHALGIDHVEQSEALMYYLMRDQEVTTLRLHEKDKEALANVCQLPKLPWQ